jgi:hypothetical protein
MPGSYTPSQSVQEAAKRAVKWIQEGQAGSGFTAVGRQRAATLAAGRPVSYEIVKRMKAYFDRHEVDKQAPGFTNGEPGFPSPGRVAWDAWGGDPGRTWAETIIKFEERQKDASV